MPLLRLGGLALLLLCAMSWLRKSASSAATVADRRAPVDDSEAPEVKKLRRTLVRRTAIVQVRGPSVTVTFDRVTTQQFDGRGAKVCCGRPCPQLNIKILSLIRFGRLILHICSTRVLALMNCCLSKEDADRGCTATLSFKRRHH